MMGDLDGSSKTLWTLYGTEATGKSHDNAHINTLKLCMSDIIMLISPYFICASVVVLVCGHWPNREVYFHVSSQGS